MAIIHRIVEAILWIPLEQKVTAKKVIRKPWKSRINLEFLIQRYGKKYSKFEMVVVYKYFTKCDYYQPVSFPYFA